MRGWMDAATLTRTLNLQGRFLARAAEGLPFLLREGMECALVPPVADLPRRVTITEVEAAQGKYEGRYRLSFAEVDAMDRAELLVGCHCLVRESEVEGELEDCVARAAAEEASVTNLVRFLAARPEASDEVTALDEEEPWTVVDAQLGPIGPLLRVEERPAQSLLVVARATEEDKGEDAAVLIPFVDELVESIDDVTRTIVVRVPAGLLDL